MAIRLSKRGWNNVLIFSALAFIGIFQFSHNQLFESTLPKASFPVDSEAVVMEVRLPHHTFQRIGSGWRSSANIWQQVEIESWLALFQQNYPLIESATQVSREHVIQLFLLAQAEPVVFFWQPEQHQLIQAGTERAWQLPPEVAGQIKQAFREVR